jgi:uncharacterized membrane protein YphA (DoxX/SURF4 family)
LVLSSVWLVTGTSKLFARDDHEAPLPEFGLLPPSVEKAGAFLLPYLELLLGAAILAGWKIEAAALASVLLLLLFCLAIAVSLLRGREIECHCFGNLSHAKISWTGVGRNLALAMAALLIAADRHGYLTVERWMRGDPLLPSTVPFHELIPALLIALSGLGVYVLLTATWNVARIIAQGEGGPLRGTPTQALLKHWPHPDPAETS